MVKAKSKVKAKQASKPKLQLNTLSRKSQRKEARKLKKQNRANFLSRKFDNRQGQGEENNEVKEKVPDTKVNKKEQEQQNREQERLRKEKKVQKDRAKQRKKQLLAENAREEREIKRLEKNLNIKKKKSKAEAAAKVTGLSLFDDDGLNDILNFCEARPDITNLMAEEEKIENPDGDNSADESGSDQSDVESAKEQSDNSDNEQSDNDSDMSDDNEQSDNNEIEQDDDSDAGEQSAKSPKKPSAAKYVPPALRAKMAKIEHSEEVSDEDNVDEDVSEDAEEKVEEEEEEAKQEEWEDIYGRKRDASGNVVKYVPPAMRNQGGGGSSNEKRVRLERQVKGQLNRLAESNLHMISRQIEDYYGQNSRNDMNEVLCSLMTQGLVDTPVLTPERLVMEHAVLVAVLHANVGTEVGASIIQTLVTQFDTKYEASASNQDDESEGKTLENYVQLICQLYAFKVIGDQLVFSLLDKLADSFTSKDVELILLALRTSGFILRKDDPVKLKALIVKIQNASVEKKTKGEDDSRTKFMLEILLAIKNNNVKKIPNYDPEHQQHMQKIIKTFLRAGAQVTPMKIGYQELIRASQGAGRWWIVGSAWIGEGPSSSSQTDSGTGNKPRFSSQLLDLARKMRMNTDARRDIFCSMMSSEDYLEATERLLKLDLARVTQHKHREVAFVVLACCLKEKAAFNPFYSQLTEKLCTVDRKYRMAAQYAVWDKVKELSDLKPHEAKNLASFVAKLIGGEALSLSSLKVIEFADLNKDTVKFLKRVVTDLLERSDPYRPFVSIAGHKPLASFREALKLFIRHFMLKSAEGSLKDKLVKAEMSLSAGEKRMAL